MNKLLQRQLKHCLGDTDSIPKEWEKLLRAISDAYDHYDDDRKLIERSLELSSKEYVQASNKLRRSAEALQRRTDQIVQQQAAIVRLAKEDVSDLDSALKRITKEGSRTLKTERVSVWVYNEDHSEIVCIDLYELSKNKHGKGAVLKVKQYPRYFKALEEDRILAANDALIDPRTNEFAEGYLSVHGITSMMDAPVRLHGKTVGIVCHEHTGPLREWTHEEQVFTSSISDMVSLTLEASKRKLAEEALAAEKERLNVTLHSIGEGVIVVDTEDSITLINKVAEKLTGWTQKKAIGKPLNKVFHIINEKTRELCENPVEKVLKTGETVGLAKHTVLVSRDGTEKFLSSSSAPIRDKDSEIVGVVLVFRDISMHKKMEEDLLKARKLESIGILAGGIAHDFNNILSAIIGNVSLARVFASSDDNKKVIERLREAEKASVRAKDLTQQLLTFSKGGAPVKKTASMAELIKDSADFALRGSNVKCEFFMPEGLLLVEIDEGQISQVINNLIINADQAMPEGGTIQARCENITIREGDDNILPLKAGKYIKLSIKDHGIGIPEEYLQKIFDPYFTTKQKGNGLGLASAYSIIEKHNGCITVESKWGVGTTFYIYLIASQKEILTKKGVEERPIMGKGKILVMDDEEAIRESVGQILIHFGYEVDFARGGTEAIELYKEAKKSGQPFKAVIIDLTIPGGMGGEETIKKLIEMDPDVKAIVSSGYSNDPVMADYEKYGFSGIVTKPYIMEELGEILYGVVMNE